MCCTNSQLDQPLAYSIKDCKKTIEASPDLEAEWKGSYFEQLQLRCQAVDPKAKGRALLRQFLCKRFSLHLLSSSLQKIIKAAIEGSGMKSKLFP